MIRNRDFESNLLLSMITLSLILADWRINQYITFSDALILSSVLVLLVLHFHKISRLQTQIYVIITAFVSINFVIQYFFNENFHIMSGFIGTMKVYLYLFVSILFYNYIASEHLEKRFLNFLNVGAIIVCVLGLYINLSIISNGILPYKFLWLFTRSDLSSYTYGAYSSIIRMRSIFSEPAHLGFFLLAVLGFSYFNKFEFKISKKVELLILGSLVLSLSFSALAVLAVMKFLHMMKEKSFLRFLRSYKSVLLLLVFVIILIFNWDTFITTILSRIQRIFIGSDTSANARLLDSWSYVHLENLVLGNGISNTPTIYSNFAYVISDLGVVGLLIFLMYNLKLFSQNKYLFVLFVLLNFMRGGYLGPGYWILLMSFSLFSFGSHRDSAKNPEHG